MPGPPRPAAVLPSPFHISEFVHGRLRAAVVRHGLPSGVETVRQIGQRLRRSAPRAGRLCRLCGPDAPNSGGTRVRRGGGPLPAAGSPDRVRRRPLRLPPLARPWIGCRRSDCIESARRSPVECPGGSSSRRAPTLLGFGAKAGVAACGFATSYRRLGKYDHWPDTVWLNTAMLENIASRLFNIRRIAVPR